MQQPFTQLLGAGHWPGPSASSSFSLQTSSAAQSPAPGAEPASGREASSGASACGSAGAAASGREGEAASVSMSGLLGPTLPQAVSKSAVSEREQSAAARRGAESWDIMSAVYGRDAQTWARGVRHKKNKGGAASPSARGRKT